MARKQIELVYPDGSKKHVGTAERDDLLLSGLAKQIAPQKYAYIGEPKTLHSFAELSSLTMRFEPQNLRRFLPGSFIFEHKDKRRRELMETPESLGMRVTQATA